MWVSMLCFLVDLVLRFALLRKIAKENPDADASLLPSTQPYEPVGAGEEDPKWQSAAPYDSASSATAHAQREVDL
jgi:hypothetical protein